jgi:hypothetical protein
MKIYISTKSYIVAVVTCTENNRYNVELKSRKELFAYVVNAVTVLKGQKELVIFGYFLSAIGGTLLIPALAKHVNLAVLLHLFQILQSLTRAPTVAY